jgi:hypothetical protein
MNTNRLTNISLIAAMFALFITLFDARIGALVSITLSIVLIVLHERDRRSRRQ